MKTSQKWLSNYVDIPWSPAELADRLTLAGLEVEGIEDVGAVPEGIVIAEILERRQHPNADKLSLCDVSLGDEPFQVVCGAPNCDAGTKVPLAPVGATIGDFKVKKAKLRGEVSYGMLCSEQELGLSEDHSGLMILPTDAPVGESLVDYLGRDTVIDWEVTPNRPDWLSHIGIAREIAALTGKPESLTLPSVEVTRRDPAPADSVASVAVPAPDLCPRYTARIIRNVTVKPSPPWMQEALLAVGLRPINNVVDITNYVLMEWGQPLHAFDLALLAGSKIIVRRAADGEKLMTLDGQEHELTSDNLLIADAERGIALAGVMGGENTEIGDTTTDVLLESAAFNPTNIRATAKALGISTDSSYRFERGVDIEMLDYAGQRAAALICELADGELMEGVIDVYAAPYVPHRVNCRTSQVERLLGVPVAADAIAGFLGALGLTVTAKSETDVEVSIPPYRLDLTREADLIEEVARLYGLNNIPSEPAPACVGGPMDSDCYYPVEQARAQLLGLGLDEGVTYTLLGLGTATRATDVTEDEVVKLANPLSSETACMRPSVLPGILQTVAHNIAHGSDDLALFEIARVVVNRQDTPEERNQVGIVLTGRPHSERFGAEKQQAYDVYDMKGLLEGFFEERRLVGVECAPVEHPALKKGAAAVFSCNGKELATFGEVSGELTSDMRLKYPLLIALVELDAIIATPAAEKVYLMLPQFPSVDRDISLVAGKDLPNQQILDTVLAQKQKLLESVELFDVYEDEKSVGAGKRSLAYTLTYRDPNKTLTDERVNQAHERIRQALAKQLPIELR